MKRRKCAKRGKPKECVNGHDLTIGSNLYEYGDGRFQCRICRRRSAKKARGNRPRGLQSHSQRSRQSHRCGPLTLDELVMLEDAPHWVRIDPSEHRAFVEHHKRELMRVRLGDLHL